MVALFIVATGCASISEHSHAYLGSPQFTATKPESIQVYASEPALPKVRLGEIVLSVQGNPSRQRLENKLRIIAAGWGADGVFIVSDRSQIHSFTYWDWYGPSPGEYWDRFIVAVAFKKK